MYCRKSVGPRMEPGGTLPLTEYYCKDFTFTGKRRNKVKYLT